MSVPVTEGRSLRCGTVPAFNRRTLVVLVAVAVLAITGFYVWMIFFNPAWDQCASRVGGQLVEHKCSEGPFR